MDEIEQLFKKTSVKVNNNKSNNLNEFKICKRIIKKLLDKINFKLPIFFYLIDIEKIYNEYKNISDFSKTDDEFIYNEITQNLEKEHIAMIENEKLYNNYVKNSEKAKNFKRKNLSNEKTDIGHKNKQIEKELNKNTPKIPSFCPPFITEISQKVMRGDFGNGFERKKNLERLGYDYNMVQKEVI